MTSRFRFYTGMHRSSCFHISHVWLVPGKVLVLFSFFFRNNRMIIKSLPVNDRCRYWALSVCRTLGRALPIYHPVFVHSLLLVEAGIWGLGMRHSTGHAVLPPRMPTQRPSPILIVPPCHRDRVGGEGHWVTSGKSKTICGFQRRWLSDFSPRGWCKHKTRRWDVQGNFLGAGKCSWKCLHWSPF